MGLHVLEVRFQFFGHDGAPFAKSLKAATSYPPDGIDDYRGIADPMLAHAAFGGD